MTRLSLARAYALAALGITLAAGGAAPRAMVPDQGSSAMDTVKAETRRYFEAVRRNDAATLESLLAVDYIEVSPLGQVDKRAQVIGFYRVAAGAQTGQASEVTEVAVDELSVRIYGDVAVAVVGESFKMNVAGKPVARPMRSTLVWQRAGGAWKIVSSHHTTVRPPLAPGGAVDR
jgi:ketosteroid isomerase-like protein